MTGPGDWVDPNLSLARVHAREAARFARRARLWAILSIGLAAVAIVLAATEVVLQLVGVK